MNTEKEWEDLTGRELVVVDYDGIELQAIVTGYEYGVGITIQDKETKEYYVCHNGPLSPLWNPKDPVPWEELFKFITKKILAGKITFSELETQLNKMLKYPYIHLRIPSAETCAFAQ